MALRPRARTSAARRPAAVTSRRGRAARARRPPPAPPVPASPAPPRGPAGRRVRLRFTRRVSRGATVEVFQSSVGAADRRPRRIARFINRKRSFTWSGRRARDGYLFVRFRVRAARGTDERRTVLLRRHGRFARRPAFQRRPSCATLARFQLDRPVFGGRRTRPLGIAYRVASAVARVGRGAPRPAASCAASGRARRARAGPCGCGSPRSGCGAAATECRSRCGPSAA